MAGENIQELTMEQDQTSLLFTLPITISGSGTVNYLLGTKDKYLNGNIGINTTTPPADPIFDGGELSGTATASSSTASISDSTNNSGVSFTTACTATRANVLYNGAVNGWVTKADNTVALTGSDTALTGKTYYINSVTVAAGKTFSATNNGTTTVTSGITSSTPKGTISISAYPASGTTIESAKSIVQNGRWQCLNSSGTVVNSVTNGTYYGKVTVASGSVTAPATISGSSATVTTGTNTVTFTKTISVTPNVTTAGYISSGTAGNSSVSLTASITTKAAATITPGTSNKEIAAGTYLTGKQTIAGDADLVASNIKHNVDIFGVTGTFTSSGTQTSGQTVASAEHIRSGYSAWVNGQEVQGSMSAVVFGNNVADGKTQSSYTDISDSDSSPVLATGSGLYINAGYIGDTYISLAKLVPDTLSNNKVFATAQYILTGYAAWDASGGQITGTMPTCTLPTTHSSSASGTSKYAIPVSTSTRYINIPKGYNSAAEYYTIRPVSLSTSLTENTKASNVKTGVKVTVGDNDSTTRLVNFTGTFTASTTATGNKGAITYSGSSSTVVLKDYSAWVDGTEVIGTIETYTGSYTIST